MRATRARRLATRLGLAVALLVASLAVLTRLASAHHPEVTATADCGTTGVVVRWTAVAWQTNASADHRVNHDVRVQLLVGGVWQQIGRGSFGAANGYQFTSTYDLPATVTGTITLRVLAIPKWGDRENYGDSGEYRLADVTVPSGCAGGGGTSCGGTLGAAGEHNLFVRGDVALAASDVGGRVAAGGDVTLRSFSVGSDITANSARVDLAVDGRLTASGGVQVASGSVTYGTALVGAVSTPRGIVTQARAPFVADTFATLAASSARWAALAPNGQATFTTGAPRTLTLTGTDPTLVVWTVSAADLQTVRAIRVRAPLTATMLVNVTGAAYDTNAAGLASVAFWNGTGYAQYGYPASDAVAVAYRTHLLWNFPTATTLQVGPSLAWEGSILAPAAAVTLPGGALNGALMAASASNGTSAVATELHPYAPNPPCLPPGSGTGTTAPATTPPPTTGTGGSPDTTISPYCRTYGRVSGRVFEDHDADGTFDTGGATSAADRGVAGVAVTVFDAAGAVVGTATSGADGGWAADVTGSAGRDVRVEFGGLPAGYLPGSATVTGGAIQFVGLCDEGVDFAVQIPGHYCQDNPDLALACTRRAGGGAPALMTQRWASGWDVVALGDAPATAADAYATGYPDAGGGTAGHPVATPAAAIGSVGGLAWRPATRTLYAAASVEPGAALGPGGASAVYAVPVAADGTGTAARVAVTLPGSAGGSPPLDPSGRVVGVDGAGRAGLGGITLVTDPASPAADALFVVGVADHRLYRVRALDAASPAVDTIDLPLGLPGAAQGCPTADLVPYGVTSWDATVYVALTCTGERAGAAAVRAYVYAWTPTAGWSPAPKLEVALTYQRGELAFWPSGPASAADNHWAAWTTDTTAAGQALVTDLAVAEGVGAAPGDLVLAVRDRTAGSRPDTAVTAGDLVRARPAASGWALAEPGLTETAHTEFFAADGFPFSLRDGSGGSGRREAAAGGVTAVPGFATVVATQRTGDDDAGIAWHGLADGRARRALSVVAAPAGTAGDATGAGAGNALGDLVALCDRAPIEIGDRVWADADGDGLQDVGEYGLAGVTLELRAANGTLVATTTSDLTGRYAFRGLAPATAYTVTVALAQDALSGRYREAPVQQGPSRALDNDGVRSGDAVVASVTTGAAGRNDHDLDIGLVGPPPVRPPCACGTTTTSSPPTTAVAAPAATTKRTFVSP